ncbi:MAG: SDR family oxidoreductase [Gammaproteobacteria bacterium]|nr:SDR family oxidoreductase [Gammaproteobacteria bacterium]
MLITNEIKSAVITGGSKGIGYAIAKYLSENGYKLLLLARNENSLKAAVESLGSEHSYAVVDVANSNEVNNAINQFVNDFGKIDLLINSAGYVKRGTSSLAENEFMKMLSTNLLGVFNMVSAVVPYMKKQCHGRIITIGSYSGKVARSAMGGYAASKFGVMGLNESLYKELAPFGISVTAICPNLVDTEMTADVNMPRDKMIKTDDIVKTVDYLINLSANVAVKEIVFQCKAKLIQDETS